MEEDDFKLFVVSWRLKVYLVDGLLDDFCFGKLIEGMFVYELVKMIKKWLLILNMKMYDKIKWKMYL